MLWSSKSSTPAFVYDDGGRAQAGFKGKTSDCVCRSLAIITQIPYEQVYDQIRTFLNSQPNRRSAKPSSPRTGVSKADTQRLMQHYGGIWHPTMQIGKGCTVHLRQSELPAGRLIVNLTRHVAAVIDGQVHDNHDCSRNGTRCVYGYWKFPDQP